MKLFGYDVGDASKQIKDIFYIYEKRVVNNIVSRQIKKIRND